MSVKGSADAMNEIQLRVPSTRSNSNRNSLPTHLNVDLTKTSKGNYQRPEPYRSLNTTSRHFQNHRVSSSGKSAKSRIEAINEVEVAEIMKRPQVQVDRRTSNMSRGSVQGRVNGGYVGPQGDRHIPMTDSGTPSAHGGSVYSLPVMEQYWSWSWSRWSRLEKGLIVTVTILGCVVVGLLVGVCVLSNQHPNHPTRTWFLPQF